MVIIVCFIIIITIVIGLLVPTPDAGAQPVLAVLGTLFSLAALYGLLRVQDKANRFVQTALAWTGVKLLFVLLMLPLAPMLPTPGHLPVAGDPVTPQQALQALFGGPAPRSAVETSALNRAGAADPGIRSAINSPKTFTVDKGTTTQAILAAPEGDGQTASASIPS